MPPELVRHAYVVAALRLAVLFAVVFYGADAIAAWRATRWQAHFAWELAIPYRPAAFLIYFSVLAVPVLPLFMLPDAALLRRWERRMAAAVLVAGAVFVVWPFELGYAPVDAGRWAPLAMLARVVSGHYNLVPSLHVALTVVTLHAVWRLAQPVVRAALAVWFAALLASVLLTHQHHLVDIVTGAALGFVCAAARRDRQGPAGSPG